MKKIIILFTIILAMLCPSVYAANFVIDNYDVNIEVTEENVLDITETIDVNFTTASHGIYRDIPLNNTVKRADGTTERNKAKISDVIVVGDPFVISSIGLGDYQTIKIGDANKTIIGEKEYTIKYKYALSKDKSKNFDELYFNIIGSEWETSIENTTFTIKMPKDFDESKLGFSSGFVGTVGSEDISYQVNDNIIYGIYPKVLSPGQALTVRLELEEGYFNVPDVKFSDNFSSKIVIILSLVAISYCIWYIHGRDMKTVETVEFYPPEGFNSAEIGFLYRGKAKNTDVISLIITLANKGYIEIEDKEDEKIPFLNENTFVLKKLKEYDGNNANERRFFDKLFKRGKEVSSKSLSRIIKSVVDDTLEVVRHKTIKDVTRSYKYKRKQSKNISKNTCNKFCYYCNNDFGSSTNINNSSCF